MLARQFVGCSNSLCLSVSLSLSPLLLSLALDLALALALSLSLSLLLARILMLDYLPIVIRRISSKKIQS